MQRIFATHLGRDIIVGGMRPPTLEHHNSKPKLSAMIRMADAAETPTPDAITWTGPAMQVLRDIEGNNQAGDCVEAEEAHFLAVVTANAKILYAYVTAAVLAMYSALTGYVIGDATTDQGTNPLDCLDYFTKNAYADGSTNLGYVLVDGRNQTEIQQAIAWFGNLKMWCCLPSAYTSPLPARNGFVWDVAPPNMQQGHCFGGYGYIAKGDAPEAVKVLGCNALGVIIATWGLVGTMTWAAVAALCVPENGGGLATRLSRDWIEANGSTPFGETADQVEAALRAMGGIDSFKKEPLAPASPPPPVTPAPAPTADPAPRPFIPRKKPDPTPAPPTKKPWRTK